MDFVWLKQEIDITVIQGRLCIHVMCWVISPYSLLERVFSRTEISAYTWGQLKLLSPNGRSSIAHAYLCHKILIQRFIRLPFGFSCFGVFEGFFVCLGFVVCLAVFWCFFFGGVEVFIWGVGGFFCLFFWYATCCSQFKYRNKEATENNNWMLRKGARNTFLIFFCIWTVEKYLLAFVWAFCTTAMLADHLGTLITMPALQLCVCIPWQWVCWKQCLTEICFGVKICPFFFSLSPLLLNCIHSISFVRCCECTNVMKMSWT